MLQSTFTTAIKKYAFGCHSHLVYILQAVESMVLHTVVRGLMFSERFSYSYRKVMLEHLLM